MVEQTEPAVVFTELRNLNTFGITLQQVFGQPYKIPWRELVNLEVSEGCLTPTWPPLNSVLPFIKYPVLNTEIIADPSSYVILNDKYPS